MAGARQGRRTALRLFSLPRNSKFQIQRTNPPASYPPAGCPLCLPFSRDGSCRVQDMVLSMTPVPAVHTTSLFCGVCVSKGGTGKPTGPTLAESLSQAKQCRILQPDTLQRPANPTAALVSCFHMFHRVSALAFRCLPIRVPNFPVVLKVALKKMHIASLPSGLHPHNCVYIMHLPFKIFIPAQSTTGAYILRFGNPRRRINTRGTSSPSCHVRPPISAPHPTRADGTGERCNGN